ncbi:MAG: hypothetical protein M3P18_09140 [Actinomycetota bacterium]|nr:hypothetical protein [Actinomycetota bacterium]
MTERDNPHDPPSLIRFPFALPDRFVAMIGYRGEEPLVGLYWEGAGDELTIYDRARLWSGMHNHWVYLELTRQPQVFHWLSEFMINLGSSDYPETRPRQMILYTYLHSGWRKIGHR